MCKSCRIQLAALVVLVAGYSSLSCPADEGAIRVATYNTSLFRDEAGQLACDLEDGSNEQARRIAEVIQRVRPDVLLVNEFDYDASGRAAELFRSKYLAVGQNGCEPIDFAHHFTAPVNTGKPSGRDLDHDGQPGGPADAIGFGRHEGQYGMLVLSKFPIDRARGVRTFQNLLWRDMPGALLPTDPKTGRSFYNDDDLAVLRLPSKSFWDVPISVPARGGAKGLSQNRRGLAHFAESSEQNVPVPLSADGSGIDTKPYVLHLLCSHPTPPVFDGPEDRNGRRNHDEIRLVAEYIDPSKGDYLVDDEGRRLGLSPRELFVIVGDLNCDPIDGQSVRGAMDQLLKHPRIDASFTPTSAGGPLTVKQYPDQHVGHRGDPAHVTSNFTAEGHGCLRIDYALPSRGLAVIDGGVFWPAPNEPGSDAVTATDHRAVWIDVISSKLP